MKYCPYCKIEVGGDPETCPLCQNQLTGTPTEKFWPTPKPPRQNSKGYKVQLFIAWAVAILIFFFDLWVDKQPGISWSIIAIIWIAVAEWTIRSVMLIHHNAAGVFTRIALSGIIVLIVSSLWFPVLLAVIPIPLICILGLNFFITLLDRNNDGMINFISAFATGLISWIVVIVFFKSELTVLWKVCLMVSCITLVGTLVFKGKTLFSEMKKRFSL